MHEYPRNAQYGAGALQGSQTELDVRRPSDPLENEEIKMDEKATKTGCTSRMTSSAILQRVWTS